MLALAAAMGVLVGITLGALGGGGSILAVPALVYVLGQDAHAATTGSLVIVGISALTGMIAHARAGRVRVGPGLTFGALGVVGSLVGSRLSATVAPAVLLTGFAGLMLVAAAAMTARRHQAQTERLELSDGPGARARAHTMTPHRSRLRAVVTLVLAATGVGLLTGFFGVGGGFVVVPALVVLLGFPMHLAVGTSLLVMVINSGVALVARLGQGVELDWPVLAAFTVAAVVGSLLGSLVASRVRPERLSFAFTCLLVVVAAYTAVRSIPALF